MLHTREGPAMTTQARYPTQYSVSCSAAAINRCLGLACSWRWKRPYLWYNPRHSWQLSFEANTEEYTMLFLKHGGHILEQEGQREKDLDREIESITLASKVAPNLVEAIKRDETTLFDYLFPEITRDA